MNGMLSGFQLILGKSKAQGDEISREKILKEMRSVAADIACANAWFEFEEDTDMLESCIYYIESLNARYRCLLKRAKTYNVNVS